MTQPVRIPCGKDRKVDLGNGVRHHYIGLPYTRDENAPPQSVMPFITFNQDGESQPVPRQRFILAVEDREATQPYQEIIEAKSVRAKDLDDVWRSFVERCSALGIRCEWPVTGRTPQVLNGPEPQNLWIILPEDTSRQHPEYWAGVNIGGGNQREDRPDQIEVIDRHNNREPTDTYIVKFGWVNCHLLWNAQIHSVKGSRG